MSEVGADRSNGLKAVIFDYGEVLCHAPTPAENQRLASFFGIGVDQLPVLWARNRGPFDRGDLTPEVYWSMLAKDAGVDISPSLIAEICELDLTMWSNVNVGMVAWAQKLSSAGVKVGLLSNMHPNMVAHCRKYFSWLKDFDCVTFSAEVRMIKPDPAIYQHTLRGLGVTASETLFLDDREINVAAAKALGIYALRFESMAQLRRDLQTIGFKLLPANS